MDWLYAVAFLAAGYTIGRARLGHRASQWAAWQTVGTTRPTGPTWWLGYTVRSIEDLGWIIAHPTQAVHDWKHRNDPPPARGPAPKLDPDWVAKRRAQTSLPNHTVNEEA